jgi:capsular polysaccharide biosynthesis protein
VIVESVRGKVERLLLLHRLPASAPARSGAAATIMYSISDNYYHWLADCLPRLYLLAQVRHGTEVSLLVPNDLSSYQRQSLELCLPEGVTVAEVQDDWVQVENLVLPSFVPEPPGPLPLDCLNYLRERIFGGLHLPSGSTGIRRLYVSRSATAYRRVVNEHELIDVLLPLGFEVVRPEKLRFEEQVRLFHSAGVIVGPRGAGLTNMMFSTGAKVLEITSSAPFVGVVYFSLAYALGHDYYHLLARRTGKNLEVSASTLRASLARMGVT